MELKAITMNDLFAVLKRRIWSLLFPALIVFLCAAIVAFSLPSIYRSTSTILIEKQDIPDDFVKTTVTSYVEQRLHFIHQRIVSYSLLLDMIKRFNLYPDLKNNWLTEEIVAKMREDIILEPFSSDVVNSSTGRVATATIAFTLSYEGKNPEKVYQVINTLTPLFLKENLQMRERQAAETTEFLENEMAKVKADLAEIEKKMAVFKESHVNELPDLLQVNVQSLNNIENNIVRFSDQLRSLKEREGYLQTQLTAIPRGFDERRQSKIRLGELKVKLMQLRTRFSDKYPDVIKTKAEIADLEKQINNSGNATGKSEGLSDNPAYITLSSQLSSTQADIESVKRQIRAYNETADMYRRRIANTPRVEEAYSSILIERNNIYAQYDDLMQKHMAAKVAQKLEKEQKGERFTLISPARLPKKPYKPNRPAILLIGLVLATGVGVGFASLKEYSDHSIHDADSLTLATSFPVLSSIPEIITEKDIRRIRTKRIAMIMALVLIILAGLAAFHYLFMELNIFWAKLVQKLRL
jgi:polysaccharide chain length determinant protein (PEP-CTERM system associated)